jgi:hypothetical protein
MAGGLYERSVLYDKLVHFAVSFGLVRLAAAAPAPRWLVALAALGLGWRTAAALAALLALGLAFAHARSPALDRPFAGEVEDDAAPVDGEATPPWREVLRVARAHPALLGWLLAMAVADLLDEVLVAFAAAHLATFAETTPAQRLFALSAWTLGDLVGIVALEAALARWPALRVLRAGAAVAALALAAQTIHHFRSDIAGHPTLGPRLVAAYAALGVKVTPHWDVQQYEIIDWIATAEPNSRGLGSLKITARIQNRGPLRQPYPAVQLRLKDRWEAAVGSRMFTPAEYLPRDAPHERLMSPGETARAEIEVVDPGPDAYGFELDVCIEVEASLVTCGTDEVFL